MLIVTRKFGQSLIIGDQQVKVTVLGIKQNQVKIGVTAPKSIPVDREEIFFKKQIKKSQQVEGNENGDTDNNS